MKKVVEKMVMLDPKFGIKLDNLMCLITKNSAYLFPVEHITSHYESGRVYYHVTTRFSRVEVDELPGKNIDIQLPELHSKKMKIFFGLTQIDFSQNRWNNCMEFVSKKVR
jgi:hypothetical protein